MKVSPGAFAAFSSEQRPLLRQNSLVWCENAVVEASGYHSPASFHKDDERTQPAEPRPHAIGDRGKYWSLTLCVHPKLLNMRDFQAGSGFPPAAKTRYNLEMEKRVRAPAWPISAGMAFHAKPRHWPGRVSCLHVADPSMM
jgi:hypothetical protein